MKMEQILQITSAPEGGGNILRTHALRTALPFLLLLLAPNLCQAQSGWFWQNPVPQGNNLHHVQFIDAMLGIGVGDVGTILRTTNGGDSWIIQNSGTSLPLHCVCFTDELNGIVVGNAGTILQTTDGGASWEARTYSPPFTLRSVCFTSENIGSAVGENGTILRTTDGGMNWTLQSSGISSDLYGITFADVHRGIAVGSQGSILRTDDGGENWSSQFSSTDQRLIGVAFSGHNSGTAGETATDISEHRLVSILLERLEFIEGIIIGTSNLVDAGAIDEAFSRRFSNKDPDPVSKP